MSRMGRTIQKPRGTQDILPSEQKYWLWVEDTFRDTMMSAGFGKIITPTIEDMSLFVRSVGELTDIVSKEMYTFKDRSANNLTLRPELTAGIVRAYIENGMHKEPQPVKLFAFGPVFRYDRPQAGRYREFYQAGAELLGEIDPVTDAQMIATLMQFYERLGLKDLTVKINTLGDARSRVKVYKALVDFWSANRRRLDADSKKRYLKNPLRVLDSKEPAMKHLIEEAGNVILDNLNQTSKDFFMKVLEYLDETGINYELDPTLVRGLDYYTHTVFEIVAKESSSAIGGGGRYDGLVKQLGGPDTPAIGFGIGVERTIELIKARRLEAPNATNVEVFVVQLGDESKKKAVRVIAELTAAGLKVAHDLGRESIKAQLRVADRSGSSLAVIIGEQEVHDDTVIIRDLADRTQESVADKKMIAAVQRKLKEKK
jgi:histidyl-tRNA synthetase